MKKSSWIIGAAFLIALIVFMCLILNLCNISIEPSII